jgi:hypothetical protein
MDNGADFRSRAFAWACREEEARTRSLAFPSISLLEGKFARRTLRQRGREERNDEQLTQTALAQRRLIDKAVAKTAAARLAPGKLKTTWDGTDFDTMTDTDSRVATALEIEEQRVIENPSHLTDEASNAPIARYWRSSPGSAEIRNILAGCWREQRVILNTQRYLSNELKISLVGFGIMEARQAINGDVQLARRFDPVTLPRWTADKEFEQLVLAIIRNLPLREPSILTVAGLRRIL